MPDFNKGDFTQQGVNGHVNATVRLNEKRLVNIDMTSNEEAEGCTIAGTVTDLLNDKVYPIGSAPSGNIEITENTAEGESLNISQYATATVNVAGGDLPFCTVTVVSDLDYEVNVSSINPETFIYQNPAIQPEDTCTCLGVYGLDSGFYVVCNPVNIPDPVNPGIACLESAATDLVNLEWVEIYQGSGILKVIDITQPSSCTIPITAWQAA